MPMTTNPFLELFASPTLKREGRSYKTCCPFHDDATPSLSVDPEKGLWRCFGCGEGGDAITFLQKARGLSFGEAADVWREMSGEEPKHRKNGRGELMETLEKTTNGAAKNPKQVNGAKSDPGGSSPPVRPELLETDGGALRGGPGQEPRGRGVSGEARYFEFRDDAGFSPGLRGRVVREVGDQ